MAAPVRIRDLQYNIKEYGFERGIVVTFTALLDEYAEHRQHMRDLTELCARCVDEIEKMVSVGSEIKQKLDQLKRERDQGEAIE